ncbi:LacI family DNA-binding transcriptional regulator [Abyssalbus ytuae]|uniref:LacI family transcriptional regulator n=1 Tax=Abyssalbus ytuae TaxID=2926907 RepID=A0A9E6ZMA4_9FLAO|nr:LacI family DNA-binding transcriptional regulator [Abyssalbus ytuae]UOB17284.1 LacI family transcriptional regulator [Abyssalbus ytuae]
MNQKKILLKDIAKKLNVSTTTVSFVLNGKGKEKKISDEVIKKIEDYVESINFRPNLVAQSLRTGKTKILVFMVEDISNYFFAKIARIIEDIAYSKGYKILFCSNENNDDRSRDLINLFSKLQVDGFIIIPSAGIKKDIENLIKNNIPVVLCDRHFPQLKTSYVVINNYEASKEATTHLINNGFKNIAFITTDVRQIQMLDRLKGYEKAIAEAGLKSTVLQIPFADTNSEKGRDMISCLFTENKELDAVFFSTNYLTQSGLEMIKETNPSLINTLGIITFDDNDLFRIYSPSISAVAQPLHQIGQELMNIMLNLLKDNNTNQLKQVTLKANLIIRNSSLRKN